MRSSRSTAGCLPANPDNISWNNARIHPERYKKSSKFFLLAESTVPFVEQITGRIVSCDADERPFVHVLERPENANPPPCMSYRRRRSQWTRATNGSPEIMGAT